MAPTLIGPTFSAHCPQCDWTFQVAADTFRPDLPTRCGQCGGQCTVGDTLSPGQTVSLQAGAVPTVWPRFELVAFKDPQGGPPLVKRIWGLPGERLSMKTGELYLTTENAPEPRLLQKTLAELERIKVNVSSFPTDKSSHWFVCGEDLSRNPDCPPIESAVQIMGGTTIFVLPAGSAIHWRFQRPAAVHPRQVPPDQWLTPSHILDDYTMNQGVSCTLHAVSDYLLSVELREPLSGRLAIQLPCHADTVTIECFNPGPEAGSSASSGSRPVQSSSVAGQGIMVRAAQKIQLAWCDARLWIKTDREQIVLADHQLASLYARPPTLLAAVPHGQLEISASTELQIKRLTVDRDLYFDDWSEPDGQSTGYFLMGDNVPVSRDSRHSLGRISADQILGRVTGQPSR